MPNNSDDELGRLIDDAIANPVPPASPMTTRKRHHTRAAAVAAERQAEATRVTQRTMVDRASDSPTTSKPRQAKRTKISKPAPAIVDVDSDVPAPKPTRAKTMRANKPDAKTIIEGVEKRVAAMAKLMANEHDARRDRGLDCRPNWQPGDPDPPQTDRRHSPKSRMRTAGHSGRVGRGW